MSWQCFLAVPTDVDARYLRRFTMDSIECPARPEYSFHSAQIRIEDAPHIDSAVVRRWPHDDPRWPTSCACGYRFTLTDEWQLNHEQLYTGAPVGGPFTWRDAPVGAMRYAPWMVDAKWRPSDAQLAANDAPGYLSVYYWRDWHGKRPPIEVQLPGRDCSWLIDSKANNGLGWQITGEPPNITATPSIMTRTYHGFLRAGGLTLDTEGRTYP